MSGRPGPALLRGLALCCCWVAGLAQAAATQELEVGTWLQRMSEAGRTLNYRGSFVYAHEGRLEAMRVVHGYQDGQERERLTHLNGSAREVVRDNQQVTCILSDDDAVVVQRGQPQRRFQAAFPADLGALRNYYQFSLSEGGRMAGRKAHKVVIAPRDAFRYGYRLWIDADNGLLLKSDVVDSSGAALEQLMFVALEVLEGVPAGELAASTGHQRPAPVPVAPEAAAERGAAGWSVGWLPEGFRQHASLRPRLAQAVEPAHFLSFSDGLASLSVFVEKPEAMVDSSGALQVGAVNAYGVARGDYYATVVGEVPLPTVRRVAESIRQGSPGAAGD